MYIHIIFELRVMIMSIPESDQISGGQSEHQIEMDQES